MLIQGRSTRVSQPTGPVEIDWANPLTSGLGFNLCNFLRRDTAGDALITRTANLAQGTTTLGQGLSSAANAAFSAPLDLSGTSEITVAFILKRDTATGTQVLVEHTINQNNQAGSFLIYTDTTNFLASISNGVGGSGNFNVVSCAAPAVGRTTKVVVTLARRGTSAQACRIWYDGVEQVTTQPNTGSISGAFANSTTYFFGRAADSLFANGVIHDISIWRRYLSDAEIGSWTDSPWRVYRSAERRVWFSDVGGGGATNYTLTASAGSYSLTGIDATLTYTPAAVNYSLTADAGAYALSGVDATLTYTVAGTAYTLSADAGAYSLTGVDATLSYVPGSGAYTLTADTGSYTLNGSDAGLTFSRRMAADVGSYTLTGVAAGLQLGRRLTADTGVYALAGVDAVLTYTSTAPIAYTLACEAGSYSLSGVDARFLVNGVGEASEHGFVLVDMPSTMWWKRKPKAITEEVAKKKIKRVVRAIEQATREQVAQPAAQQQREVYQAIAPLLEEMPGFDWKQVFRLIVAQDTARRQMEATIARAKQIEQDDEDVLLLMLL